MIRRSTGASAAARLALVALLWASTPPGEAFAEDARDPALPREDALVEDLAQYPFNELQAALSRQTLNDPAALYAHARALCATSRDGAARTWAVGTVSGYLDGEEVPKESVVAALVVETYVATADDRELLRKCAKDDCADVADLARVALASVGDPADRGFFLDELERVAPSDRWSAAAGVVALGDAASRERFKRITSSPGWRLADDPRGALLDVVVMGASIRLARDAAAAYRATQDGVRNESRSGAGDDEAGCSVRSILELKLEGELGKRNEARERRLIDKAWTEDRRAVVAAISVALAPQVSSGSYDRVRAINAIELLETAQSAEDLDAILRRVCSDPKAQDPIRLRALDALASHGVVGSAANRLLLVRAVCHEPTARGIAADLIARADAGTAIALRSEIGRRQPGDVGLSDAAIARAALVMTALSR